LISEKDVKVGGGTKIWHVEIARVAFFSTSFSLNCSLELLEAAVLVGKRKSEVTVLIIAPKLQSS
jgi:hypothetical protein